MAQSGYYNIQTENNNRTYGYIYKDNFSPFNPSINIYLKNYDGYVTQDQFKCFNTTYIWVVTTFSPKAKGAFLIIVFGPKNVTLKRFSEYIFDIFPMITRERRNSVNVCKLNFYSRSTRKLRESNNILRIICAMPIY